MARVNALPRDYRYVFKKIQNHMWQFAAGAGYDMIEVQGGLLELFEQGVTDGKNVLDVTGKDVAGFCDELLKSVNTTKSKHKDKFNRDILDKLDK